MTDITMPIPPRTSDVSADLVAKRYRAERRFLLAVAERAGEENHAALFFRKSLFEETVAEMNADPDFVDGLRRKVFGP